MRQALGQASSYSISGSVSKYRYLPEKASFVDAVTALLGVYPVDILVSFKTTED